MNMDEGLYEAGQTDGKRLFLALDGGWGGRKRGWRGWMDLGFAEAVRLQFLWIGSGR